MPPQLKTLLPLLFGFVVVFLIVRSFLVPDSFGQYGHYRGDSLKDNANHTPQYVGNATCADCHTTEAEMLASDMHASLKCEVCHGPGAKHVESTETDDIIHREGSRRFCGSCHGMHPARNIENIYQVNIEEHHSEKEKCIDCHNPHAVWELKE